MLLIFYMGIIQHLFQDLNHFVEYPIFLIWLNNASPSLLVNKIATKKHGGKSNENPRFGFSFDFPPDQQQDILSGGEQIHCYRLRSITQEITSVIFSHWFFGPVLIQDEPRTTGSDCSTGGRRLGMMKLQGVHENTRVSYSGNRQGLIVLKFVWFVIFFRSYFLIFVYWEWNYDFLL